MILIQKLKEKKGSAVVLAVAVSLSLLLLMTVLLEYFRIKTITSHIEETLQATVINASIDNYENIHSSTREGYISANLYDKIQENWNISINEGNILKDMSKLLGLTKNGDKYIKNREEKIEYEISNLNIKTSNPPLKGSPDNKLIIESKLDFEIPYSFGWDLPPLRLKLKSNSEHMIMF